MNDAISAAFAEIRRIDALMSLHRADSELQRVNASAAADPVAVSPDLFRVLTAAVAIAAATDGGLDITVEPLTQLWGFIWKEYRLPTDAELAAVLPRVDYRHLELTPATQTVRFKRPGVRLDLGGIAKGYAVDCAVEKLRALGIANAMVRAGGDLRAIGHPPTATRGRCSSKTPPKPAAASRSNSATPPSQPRATTRTTSKSPATATATSSIPAPACPSPASPRAA